MKRSRPDDVPDLFAEADSAAAASHSASADDPAPVVAVLLPLPLDEPFDYLAGAEPLPPGALVEVPFGPRSVAGVVWPRRGGPAVARPRLKAVGRRLDAAPLPSALLALVEHVAGATLAPLGNALRLVLPVPGALEPPVPKLGVALAPDPPPDLRRTAARAATLGALGEGEVLPAADLARRAGVGGAVVRGLIEAGALVHAPLPEPEPEPPDPDHPGVALTEVQRRVADALAAAVPLGHRVMLLEGVPGAGKTEVYLEAVAEALRRGRQALVLLPEIALSAQLLGRFERRFGQPPLVWHSELGGTQRRRAWRRIVDGKARIVIGARSALFLPLDRLGLIVVDEEHDQSFKQEDGVAYHGRDMAIARARIEDCPVMLVSATPALDSAYRSGRIGGKRGERVFLLPARHGGAPLPRVHLLDLKKDRPPAGRWLAPSLVRALEGTFERREQALLFLNRRGFAPLTICRACGQRVACPNCDAWLVSHRFRDRLLCHHCGFSRPAPDFCPGCGTVEALVPCGPGVERLAEEAAALFPAARLAVMTSDSPGGPRATADLLRAMHDHELDLLIGTQIIAKGHHFPDLTLVGVVDGDLGLAGGDLRAGERQFQLLYQVAGRAGRAGGGGTVVVQTHLPEHPVMQALATGDKERFYEEELAQREEAGLPPFGQLAALVVSGRDQQEVRRLATDVARTAPSLEGFRVLGPAPPPLALLRGRFRQRLLVIARPEVDLQGTLRPWLAAQKTRGNLQLQVDVDPYSFL